MTTFSSAEHLALELCSHMSVFEPLSNDITMRRSWSKWNFNEQETKDARLLAYVILRAE